MPTSLTFITTSDKKLSEVKSILGSTFDVTRIGIDLPEIQGTGEEIVMAKCLDAYKQLQCSLIVEDTSLEFEAWNGLPGPYIKDFCAKNTLEQLYSMVKPLHTQNATAICRIGYVDFRGDVQIFEGRLKGSIVEPIGTNGFGFDAIFKPDELESGSFATVTAEVKNSMSHRTRALNEMKIALLV